MLRVFSCKFPFIIFFRIRSLNARCTLSVYPCMSDIYRKGKVAPSHIMRCLLPLSRQKRVLFESVHSNRQMDGKNGKSLLLLLYSSSSGGPLERTMVMLA